MRPTTPGPRFSTPLTGTHLKPLISTQLEGSGRSIAWPTPGGAAFHPDLPIRGDVVTKGTDGGDGYSGFSVRDPESGEESATELAGLLKQHDIRHIVVVGIATDVCVNATVADARRLGFDVTVLADATAAVELKQGDTQAALDQMRQAGAIVEGEPAT